MARTIATNSMTSIRRSAALVLGDEGLWAFEAARQPSDDREGRALRHHRMGRDYPEDQAINEPGLFRNRKMVCWPKTAMWRTTIARLRAFPRYDAV